MVNASGVIRKIGNSQGVILDKKWCDTLGLNVGAAVSMTFDEDRIIIKPENTARKPIIGVAKGQTLAPDSWFDDEFEDEIAGMMGALP